MEGGAWTTMRGGDGCGVSAIEPHLVHTNTEQQPGRPPRRSGRRENTAVAANGSLRVDNHPNSRAEGSVRNGCSGNIAALSSIDQERNGVAAEEGVRASIRGGDGVGLSALETQVAHASKESRRPPRRSVRRESSSSLLPSSSNGRGTETSLKRGGSGTVRNLFPVVGAASSSSVRVEPASRGQRVPSGGVVTRDRSSKRAQRCRATGVEAIGLANGYNESNPVAQKNGKSRLQSNNQIIITSLTSEIFEEDQQAESPRERMGEYFPLINDEVGLQCLTRLPRHRIYKMKLVCKKWNEFLSSYELYVARLRLGLREDWVFILGNNVDKNWRAFLPEVGSWVMLPSCPSDYTFDSCDKESMVAGLNLLVLGQNKDGFVIWKFDTIQSKWSTTPRMNTDRCMFGSATFGQHAYFAGGTSFGKVLKSVERYDSEANSWESVADMNHDRKACSGFVMDGKFHVIGGHVENVLLSSGEAYDPQTGTWTVIEGMWPQEFVPSMTVSPPLVAVLNNQLYAINIIQNMLMLYNKEFNRWLMLEKVPFRAENTNGWGLGFKAVGDELFVIGGARGSGQFLPKIHAYKPRVDEGETWRHVTDLKIPTNGFIYNCAVMSG